MEELKQEIHRLVTENPVVLFIKGTPQFPMCGFSGRAVQVLKASGVKNFLYVNVLEQTPEFQAAACEYANWPTWPQLYIRGEFIGGCDIMTEMAQAGELQEKLGDLAAA